MVLTHPRFAFRIVCFLGVFALIAHARAELLTSRDPSKNHYQSIFADLYRRFEVSSYKLIRQDQYQAVLAFLDDWRRTL